MVSSLVKIVNPFEFTALLYAGEPGRVNIYFVSFLFFRPVFQFSFSRKETITNPSALSVRTCTHAGSSQVSSTISR